MRVIFCLSLFVLVAICGESNSAKPYAIPNAKLLASNPNDTYNSTKNVEGFVMYKQCDSRWGSAELGTWYSGCAGVSVCAAGCAMSSTAMFLATRGVSVDPGSLNTWLKANGGYESGCGIIWGTVDRFGHSSFQGFEHADYAAVCTGVSNGHGVIINVRGGKHWVLVVGCTGDGSTFFVNDPYFNQDTYTIGDVVVMAVYH